MCSGKNFLKGGGTDSREGGKYQGGTGLDGVGRFGQGWTGWDGARRGIKGWDGFGRGGM